MKKLLHFFMTLTALCGLIFSLCLFVSAEEGRTVVFLETGADGNGFSDDRPVGSLGRAVEILDKDEDCTIVICGKFSQTGNFTYPEEFTGSITITSVYDGVDYRKFGAEYDCVGARFVCTGEYVFKDIDIRLSGKYMFVIANHNPFTIDTGVNVIAEDPATDGLGFGTSLSILGGYQSGQPELRGIKDPPPFESDEDTNITVNSGAYICIGAYSRQIDGANYTGTANINIGGNADVKRVFLTPANKPFTCGDINLTVSGDAKISEIYASTSTGTANSFTLNWLGGSIGSYSDKLASGNDIIFENGKKLAASDEVKASDGYAKISGALSGEIIESDSEGTLTVVYLKGGADGDGTSALTPTGSLGNAVELLDKTKDCTIVVCGKFSQTGAFTYPKTFSGSITITSVFGGVDYRKDGAEYDCVGARFVCTGEYVFKDINIRLSGKYMFVIANHHPFTIDTGVNIIADDPATDGLGFGTAFGILGGYQSGQPELRGVKDPPPAESDRDTNITVKSGAYICISAYSRQIDGANYTGTANINIGGNADVKRVFLTPANKPFTCGDINLTVSEKATVGEIYASTSIGFADSFTLNWLGGSIGSYANILLEENDIIFEDGKILFYSENTKNAANYDKIAASFDSVYEEGTVIDTSEYTVVKMTIGKDIGYVNGAPYTLDAAPIIRESRTMLPVRFVAEAFGAKVGWDGATSTATLTTSDVEIKITIGAKTAYVNGIAISLDAPAFIENSRTYMPVRFVAENLGATVAWDGATSTATLTKKGIFSSLPEDTTVADGIKLNLISALNSEKVTPDSHEGLTASSSVELNFREYTEIPAALLSTSSAMYPRIKKMQNGEYILFYQNGQIGSTIYYTTSPDTINWTKATELFKLHAATNGLGEQDSIRYTTCDAVVLANGDILAVASFRYNQGYAKAASEGGLVLSRSTDNGKTWSEEKVIYVGINWEPYITQTKSGEVQIFFTHNAPKFYLDGKLDKDYLSSGVGKIVSKDNGETWIPSVVGAPYSASIVMQQLRKVNAAKTLYTDQMPSVVYLNNGTSVMAVESRPDNGELYISLGYSSDEWNTHLDTEEVGPVKRADNIFEGAAPYITQFDSGETLLSYNVNNRFSVRIGDTNGENFGESIIPFTKTGYWGTLEKRSSHSAIGSIANSVSDGANSIMVGTLYLNHAINAPAMSIALDGNNEEWASNTEALFIGSECQAQVSIRVAQDSENYYFLFERADYSLTSGDSITLYLTSDGVDGFWRIRIGEGGIEELVRSGKTIEKKDAGEVGYAAINLGTAKNTDDTDIGKIVEISVPKSLFSGDTLRVNALMYNQDKNESKVSDTFAGAKLADANTWPIVLVK